MSRKLERIRKLSFSIAGISTQDYLNSYDGEFNAEITTLSPSEIVLFQKPPGWWRSQ
jgi:hypothetical protein